MIRYLSVHQNAGGKVAVYGAGCRACSLVNFAGLAPYVEFVVDDQIERQGKYMPGSRLRIGPSEILENGTVDLCLLGVNAENESRVISRHQDYLQNGGRFASIHPPSERLLPVWSRI